jgi:anti-sigma regulatory factor (Ser/Thr protein kinase)
MEKTISSAVTYKMMAEALFENYESIYDINLETEEYKTYYQSTSYQELELAREGTRFFDKLAEGINRILAPEARDYVLHMLQKDRLVKGVECRKHYRIVYRIQNADKQLYHQLSATLQQAEDGMHILMGIRNIDHLIRQRLAHEDEVRSLQQKEHNHLEAVLASASAYLEANLSRNLVLEKSVGLKNKKLRWREELPDLTEVKSYDGLQNWFLDHLVSSNKEGYQLVSSRDYLRSCFQNGTMRATVSFSVYARDNGEEPCRAVFYLYQEKATGDLHVFTVIYDLTEQQKKDKELKELEEELNMSRIRNSTSQMQPHFLYNALGSIQELILIDPAYASDLLGDFMVHLRSCVRAMENDKPIPFSEELKNIRAYTNIEKMRLGKKLDVKYEIQESNFFVLPLSIQPLVENAIRHGIHKRGKTGGTVTLRTEKTDDAWIIEVEDDGVGFNVDQIHEEIRQKKRSSTGLKNIRFRIKAVLNGSLNITSTEGEGTVVTVSIPRT